MNLAAHQHQTPKHRCPTKQTSELLSFPEGAGLLEEETEITDLIVELNSEACPCRQGTPPRWAPVHLAVRCGL